MGNRTAKFVSALVGSIIAGAPLAAVSQNAPGASSTAGSAGDCLASPKGSAPQGQHWHYRVERGTKRQCWYLRAEGSKESAKPVQTAQATSDTPATDLPSPAPQQHAATDARAEYLTPRSAAAIKTPAPVAQAATQPQQSADQTATSDAQQPASAAPWPDVAATSNPPAPEPAPAAQASAKPSKSSLPMALAAADSSADKPTGSLQMLLLVVGGALALAGILASVIYRFAGARVRASNHRRVNWDDREPQQQDRAPWLNAMPATPRARQPRPIDFDAVRPQAAHLAAIDHEIDVIEAHEPPAAAEAAQHGADEIPVFDREFEIATRAPRLAANEAAEQHDDRNRDAVDIDIITTMLERLLNEGPRLSPASPEAELAALAQSRRGQSAARA
ncbi:hypothetical protein A5906_02900 [Bradyrhizobium sacchari]|uniref:Uncharacterized protein n=1 Tax=Bradyrhizobium sacchari TaxID=1399419 RepID=A0A560KLU9_9BRAD|nr:hypothetical protein [Bradyrhizobium sacchari]OPY96233.1 hypothetical protein A5906_02900 [Bradyrhizobium sacchari]TWB66959.1 hypothetical protein FBZ94_101639 [Bradyrhizobium sacchari]TWB84196.1 hypothetical protein FBZ95_101639 [Bradyrhizobium sacchari]